MSSDNNTLENNLPPLDEQIAIVGMGCRFPGGANNPELYWDLLFSAKDGIIEVPSERWDVDNFYDPDPDSPGKSRTKKAGFLDVDVTRFDAAYFKISPREAEQMDPQQRLLLEVVIEALEQSGIAPSSVFGTQTGVFLGIYSLDYSNLLNSTSLTTIDSFRATGSASMSVASGRVSYILNLKGANFSIDTACSSSLVAIDTACHYLQSNEINMALVGGVNLMLSPVPNIVMSKAGMLAPDGRCKTFDASADGFGRGEGCGVVVLKRLSDAKKNNDRILAVIKGSGVNQDGASNGLTAPNGIAQKDLILHVCQKAGIEPGEVDYIETHGTGTSLGDPIEVAAIAETYGHRDASHPLMMGAVKTNIGHTESAAGIAGLIKAVLILNHEMVPANLNFKELNPNIELNFPVKMLTEKIQWRKGDRIRRAAVSSFGFSGVNAHVIVEEAPVIEPKVREIEERPLHILTLSAKTEPALNALIENYQHALQKTDSNLADICYSANTGRNHELYRIAVIAKDLAELKTKLNTSEFIRGKAKVSKAYAFAPTGDWRKDLNELAMAYINGALVDWKKFDAAYAREKVTLPTYPFQRKRYWLDFLNPSLFGKKIDFFYETNWIQDFSPTVSITDPRKIAFFWINSDESVLAKLFEMNGSFEAIINHSLPSNKFEILSLLENLNSQHSLTDIIVDATLLNEVGSIEESLVKLLYVIQSVLDIFKNASPRLYFITSSNPLVFEAVRSMQLSVLQEQPTLLLTHVGMDISENEWQSEALESVLFQKREDTSILIRDNHLYVPRFVRVKEDVEKVALNINPAGIYLVTGGMGAIGLEVVKFLLQEGAGGVVITGRSVLDDAIQKRIDRINFPSQKIQYFQMDVSDFDSVKSCFKNIQDTMGEIKGIFHLAGVLKDDLLLNQTSKHFSTVLPPKLIGSYNLHQASENYALDYFVLFSSLASTLGNPGQINYAAANGFMNGLAISRRAKGLPGISIAWGPWGGAGMARELTQRMAQQGVGAISSKEGMKYLKALLMRDEAVVTCSPIHWDRYFSQYTETPIWLSAFFPEKKSKVDIYEQLRFGDHENNRKILYPFIAETIASAIVLSDSQIVDPNKNFYDMGMDSLMMMSVSNQLRAALNNHPDISPALLIENPSVHQLSLALESLLEMDNSPLLKPHISNTIEIMNSPAWITELPANKKPDLRIFCFAHAGGGKSLFLNWRSQLPDSISLCLVQLPGREDRIHESMPLIPEQIISSIVNHMLPYLDLPYVLVGHSFGALLCYDVMLELKRLSLPMPLHAFLSSYNPDRQDAAQYIEEILNLSEDEFFKEVQDRFQGLPRSILEDKKLKNLIFPALKADFAYMAHHPSLQKKILDVSISTLSGDAEKITPDEMAAWREYTSGEHEHQTLAGGHFMISDNQKGYLEFLLSRIKKL